MMANMKDTPDMDEVARAFSAHLVEHGIGGNELGTRDAN